MRGTVLTFNVESLAKIDQRNSYVGGNSHIPVYIYNNIDFLDMAQKCTNKKFGVMENGNCTQSVQTYYK